MVSAIRFRVRPPEAFFIAVSAAVEMLETLLTLTVAVDAPLAFAVFTAAAVLVFASSAVMLPDTLGVLVPELVELLELELLEEELETAPPPISIFFSDK